MRPMFHLVVGAAMLAAVPAMAQDKTAKVAALGDATWQEEFGIDLCPLATSGRNDYFVLEPGFQTVLESKEGRLVITVLDETKMVNGILTRVVEEREWKDGELYEVARNFYAICERTKDVFYFGEEVDFYKKGKVVDHSGSWMAGQNGARPGMIMPGKPKIGMRYYQEVAPGVAMDRAEVIKVDGVCKTPAGSFSKCLTTKEGTSMDLTVEEFKSYAPGIGLIRDAEMQLIKHGFRPKKK